MFRRTIVSDVVQGIIIGGVLAFITAQIIMNAYVTTVNGWTTTTACNSLDRSNVTDFAYVGTRTTGTQAGDYLVSGPGWEGQVPSGMTQIASPNNSVLVIGRVLVYSYNDLPTAYGLAKLIQLAPLSSKGYSQ